MNLLNRLKDFLKKHYVIFALIFVLLSIVLSSLITWKVVTFFSSSCPSSPSSTTTQKPPTFYYEKEKLPEWFEQRIDHFNSSDTRTFKQRFWTNDRYYYGNGIHFLWIGGENEESFNRINGEHIPIVSWAKKLNAKVWNLEHRFYGKSRPTRDTSVESLKYLTSRQALEDLANFIKTKNNESRIDSPRWVLFGGSYAGRLALWFREKYPKLTVGAVASSAPMKLVAIDSGYYQTVQNIYEEFDSNCSIAIQNAFQRINTLLKNDEEREKLNDLLTIYSPFSDHLNEKEAAVFFHAMASSISTQYTTQSQLRKFCDVMTKNTTIDYVTRLMDAMNIFAPNRILTYNYTMEIVRLRDISIHSPYSQMRLWIWQMCTEQGGFGIIDHDSFFGQNTSKSFIIEYCADLFGKKFGNVEENVKKAIEFYGPAENYNGTNVILTNGNLDPWSAFGIHESKHYSMFTIMINGTSHCKDLVKLADEKDPVALKNAQTFIFGALKIWTYEPFNLRYEPPRYKDIY